MVEEECSVLYSLHREDRYPFDRSESLSAVSRTVFGRYRRRRRQERFKYRNACRRTVIWDIMSARGASSGHVTAVTIGWTRRCCHFPCSNASRSARRGGPKCVTGSTSSANKMRSVHGPASHPRAPASCPTRFSPRSCTYCVTAIYARGTLGAGNFG